MNALIVYAHPEPTSFSGSMKDHAIKVLEADGHNVEVADLYKENFNPVASRDDFTSLLHPDKFHLQAEQEHASLNDGFSEDIRLQQERVEKADLLVFVFPLWWGGMPAILKGWVDRVLAYGFAYIDGHRYDSGLFQGRRGVLGLPTGGGPRRFSKLEEGGVYGEIGEVLYPLNHCIVKYFGLELMDPFVAYSAPRVSEEDRKKLLDDWGKTLLEIVNDKVWQKYLAVNPKLSINEIDFVKSGWNKDR